MNGQTIAVQIAAAGDGAWFARNPDRRLRLRNMIPGEFSDIGGEPPVGMAWRTIVIEAQPGARSRQAIALPLGTDIEQFTDEALFELFVQVAPTGARQVIASLRKVKLPVATGAS
ncbi:hypothetical protein C8J44_0343 [Sphingomonas sp. PP-CE-3A-406]|uniref:hypothetical protein n=1 Tax=Sphingomonas sp. PP-CE-3A-406 TaxID=2135659 RepID=UPI000EF8F462|nr:hypothetical protein [Sphingomonas sp. PP-CE-3A-406]RMB55110.1 hypothetical protein C8J44_0343 [Sphingomonas sp. PP-CE-3A-406]